MAQSIIFVDIDGPLMSRKMHMFHENRGFAATTVKNPPKFDEFSIRAFNLWAKYSDAKIVLSTYWAWSFTTDQIKDFMITNGLGFDYHDVIETPKRNSSTRNTEIVDWLAEHSDEGDTFIAVDDDTSCRYIQDGMEASEVKATGKWIQVDFDNGLSWDNFLDGCDVLGIDIDDIYEHEFGIKKLTEQEKAARHSFDF